MTNTALLTEILNRCGEGYENWTERAKAHFKTACIQLISSDRYHETEYPGLVYQKAVTSLTGATVAITSVIETEIIKLLSLTYTKSGGTATDVHIISQPEYEAYLLNTALIPSGDIYAYQKYDGISPKLVLSTTLEATDTLLPTYVAWDATIWTTPNTSLNGHFSDEFMETAIQMAVATLKQEIVE